jgi:hypothetical protein
VPIDPAVDARVMAAVRELPRHWDTEGAYAEDALAGGAYAGVAPAPGALRAAWRWLRRPRPVAVSPLGGLALAAGVAALLVLRPAPGTEVERVPANDRAEIAGPPAPVTPVTPVATLDTVQFALVAPEATSVHVVGDFNDWDARRTPLARGANGVWLVEVPLVPGRHRYAFIVNGSEWTNDPTAPRARSEFGKNSSVVTVGEKTT